MILPPPFINGDKPRDVAETDLVKNLTSIPGFSFLPGIMGCITGRISGIILTISMFPYRRTPASVPDMKAG